MKRRFHRYIALALVLTLALFTFAACGGDTGSTGGGGGAPAADNVSTPDGDGNGDGNSAGGGKNKLAATVPLTGNLMQYGISYKNALEMAVADFNAAGGLNGVDVVLEVHDDKGEQTEAINLANKIIDDDSVFTVVASYGSSVSMAAAPVYQKANLPMVSPNSSHPDFPGIGDMMIPISPTAEVEKARTVQIYYDAYDGGDLAVLYQNTDLGVTANEIIHQRYTEMGGNVVASETFVPSQTKDFTPLLSKLKQAGPTAIVIEAEYSDCALILIQAEQLDMGDIKFCGSGQMFKSEFLDLVGTKADGIILSGTTPVYEDSVMADSDLGDYIIDFTRRYNELYDTPCDGFAAAAYDAAMLAMTAARNVGTDDPHALIAEMLTAPIDTVCGLNMRYENGNNVYKDAYAYTIEDGKFKVYSITATVSQ